MNLLFLRGKVPTDRDPKQIWFEDIDKCDDVWTQLASHLVSKDDYGELWYWIAPRKDGCSRRWCRDVLYRKNFVERWILEYNKHLSSFIPDVIFARGGFPQYDVVLEKFPKAFKIYYGAGRRFVPQSKFNKYNLILVDTPKQLKRVRKLLSNVRCELFIKPSADNIFRPIKHNKEYDVIFSSNEHKSGIKGHNFILPLLPSSIRMIQLGIVSSKLKKRYPHVDFKGWVPRKKIPEFYAKAKVAIICCTNVDSCPRIISEALACNCPVLLRDSVNIWHDKYINKQTGRVVSDINFIPELHNMIKTYATFHPYEYYTKYLSLKVAAKYIRLLVETYG